MGYKECLKLAGAIVIDYEEFGSSQGDWIAVIKYNNDKIGFIKDYYGSCDGCDAFQDEFSDYEHVCIDDEYHSPHCHGYRDNCSICQEEKQKAINFGKEYLKNIMTYEEIHKKISKDIEWDLETQEMIDFINKYK